MIPAPPSPTPKLTPVESDAGDDLRAVLLGEEIARARVFFRAFLLLAVIMGGFVPILPGPTWLRIAAGIVLLTGASLCGIALLRIRDEKLYTPNLVVALGVGCAVVDSACIHYVGPFSAGAMVLSIGIYFFATSGSKRAGPITWGVVAVLYLISSAGVAAGVFPDVSLFPIAGAAPVTRWFQVIMSQVIFAITLYLARSNRQAMQGAIERVHRIGMEVRQRDAQLAEARRELDKALRPGDGRHSGETVGAYKLGQLVGRGGMGEVYRGTHLTTGKVAAVKLLHPYLLDNPDHVRRFLREAKVTAAVRTQHVVEVLELGETKDGSPFLAMELLEGHDLGWHLRKVGKLQLPAVIELVDQLAGALVKMREEYSQPAPPAQFVQLPSDVELVLAVGLAKLCEREVLVRRNEGKFPGEQEYAFRHALLREAAYGMLTDEDRTLGHRLAGQWLERVGEGQGDRAGRAPGARRRAPRGDRVVPARRGASAGGERSRGGDRALRERDLVRRRG